MGAPLHGCEVKSRKEKTEHSAEGDDAERLFDALYHELHHQAQRCMERQPPGHTLQPTALVNETFLKLAGSATEGWKGRAHFMSVAAKAMRSVLVDHARSKDRLKRQGAAHRISLENVVLTYDERAVDLLLLDDALERLAAFDEHMARAVELRFFAGLNVEETAQIVGMSKRALERQWAATRAWLHREVR